MAALLLLLLFVVPVLTVEDCIITTENGHYDLTSLSSPEDYKVESERHTYYLNVCRPVVGELWNPEGVDNPQRVGVRYRGERGDYSIGEYNTTLRFEHNNPLLLYDNGSPCAADMNVRASTAIRFLCDNTIFGSGEPLLVTSLPPGSGTPCAFFFEWRTHVACPTAPRTTLSSAIGLIIGLVLLFLFLLVALLLGYRRFAMQKRGIELFPRPSLGGFGVVETLRRWLRPTRDRWESQSRHGSGRSYYESLDAEEENRPLHEGTRLSFEDDSHVNSRPFNGPEEAATNAW